MSMFDYYRPAHELRCPVCFRPLRDWQGKDGPNALFVWSEGHRAPLDQVVDEEVMLSTEQRERFTLPRSFVIYSYDCPEHQPVEAKCETSNGVWSRTDVCPYNKSAR